MLDPFYDEQSQIRFARLEKLLQNSDATAIIGAGASITAGMPSWRDLYSLFYREVHGDEGKYNAKTIIRELQELRNQLGDDGALQLVKNSFNKPVDIVPETYRLTSDAFRRVATTNYDNFLMALALRRESDPTIEIYPRVKMEARYFYLHGHAGTAESLYDIVLCADEYDYAYNPENGAARNTLWRLLQDGPCVFLGTSLEDPDFLHTIEQTERFRHRKIRTNGDGPQSFDPDPNWFLFKTVPKPSDIQSLFQLVPDEKRKEAEDIWIDHQVRQETERFLSIGIKPIWYMRDSSHSRLNILLQRLAEVRQASMKGLAEPVFLTQAEELESLGKVEHPDETQQRRLLELLRSLPEARRHFFEHATSPAWIDILYDESLISLVPEPQQDSNGVVSIQPWEAAPYIMKLLKVRPKSVVTVIKSVQTTNWHALQVLSTAMTELPTDLLLPLIPAKILEWLETPYQDLGSVATNSISVCNRLVDEGLYEKAAKLIEVLLQPQKRERHSRENSLAGYEAPDVLESANRLSTMAPQITVATFQQLLEAAIALEFDGDQILVNFYWSTWRPAIEDSEATLSPDSTLNILVSGLREAVKSLIQNQPDSGRAVLNQYLTSSQVILKRIGLHIISLHPELIANLEDLILPSEAIFDTATFHETATLLQEQFAEFSEGERARILKIIKSGPSSTAEKAIDENRKAIWQWHLLSVLPVDELTRDLQELRKALRDQWGAPDPLTFLAVPQVTFAKAPASLEQVRELLSSGGADGLMQILRSPEKHFTTEWNTDMSLGWEHVRTLAIESPFEMLSLAPLMTFEDLEIDGVWWYLDAYMGLADEGVAFDWQPLIDLADISLKKLSEQPGWNNSSWLGAIARLLEAGIVSANRIPDDQISRVFQIFSTLIKQFARTVATITDDDDLHIHQLNSIAGISADGLVLIAWRCLEETAPKEVRKTVREQLLGQLGDAIRGTWGGQEVIFAIGRNLPALERLSTIWVENAIKNLYNISDEIDRSKSIRSFWNGYLTAPRVYNNVMRMLQERYGEMLQSLEREAEQKLAKGLQSQLAEHIVIGWLRDLEGFGIEGLAGSLAHAKEASLLEHTAWYIGKQLDLVKELKPDSLSEVWETVLAYWRLRTEILERDPSLDTSSTRGEADRFIFWLKVVDVQPEEIARELKLAIRLTSIGYAWRQVTEYLLGHAARNPSFVLVLASALADRWTREPELVISSSEYGALLKEIVHNGSNTDQTHIKSLVDNLLREGKADFREVLYGT